MHKFPKPYLKYLHPYLARQCTHSAFACVIALSYHVCCTLLNYVQNLYYQNFKNFT